MSFYCNASISIAAVVCDATPMYSCATLVLIYTDTETGIPYLLYQCDDGGQQFNATCTLSGRWDALNVCVGRKSYVTT